MHHLYLPTQTNKYDCGIFVLAYQRATQLWLRTYLPSPHAPMDLRLTTLKATLRQVTQTRVTFLETLKH